MLLCVFVLLISQFTQADFQVYKFYKQKYETHDRAFLEKINEYNDLSVKYRRMLSLVNADGTSPPTGIIRERMKALLKQASAELKKSREAIEKMIDCLDELP